MLTAAAQNGSDFCKRRKLPSFELKILLYRVNWKKSLGRQTHGYFPDIISKACQNLKLGPKSFSKKQMGTLTESGDHRSEWSVFEDLDVTIFAFYAIITRF